MWKKFLLLAALGTLIAALPGSPASAQATRTWVSGVGDDANPCSRTAPCKTWAGAISKTAAGGEIDALDPGGFGAVTITKAITIDGGGGQVASTLVQGTNGIVVSAGTNDIVIIRNMRINGLAGTSSGGLNGILFNSGKQLNVENCDIFGFTQSGIAVNSSTTTSELYVTNTYITNSANGITLATGGSSSNLVGAIDHAYIFNVTTNALASSSSGNINFSVTNSVITSATTGITAGGSGTRFNVDTSTVGSNTTAFNASVSGATIRISNNNVYDNGTNYSIATGGAILSAGNNRSPQQGPTNPSGSVPLQ
ncbi:MAG TPA: hypothetical protein VMF32_01840 [Xanthobacteraceae bacterium]|nr:hypothetical protein [Xanthobacteraceae bacterium]